MIIYSDLDKRHFAGLTCIPYLCHCQLSDNFHYHRHFAQSSLVSLIIVAVRRGITGSLPGNSSATVCQTLAELSAHPEMC